MGWIVRYKEEKVEKPLARRRKVLFDGTLKERAKRDGNGVGFGGDLVRVWPDEEKYYRMSRSRLRQGSFSLLRRIKTRFSTELISYQELWEVFEEEEEAGENNFKLKLCSLWAKGFLEKWVSGKFGQGDHHARRGLVGKWHGVHYRVVK